MHRLHPSRLGRSVAYSSVLVLILSAILLACDPVAPVAPTPSPAPAGQEAAASEREKSLQATVGAQQTQLAQLQRKETPVATETPIQGARTPSTGSFGVILPPTPTITPVPSPTLLPDTPLGATLSVGETWRQGGLELNLEKADIRANGPYGSGKGALILFRITNLKGSDISLRYSLENITAVENRGRRLTIGYLFPEIFMTDSKPATLLLRNGESTYLHEGFRGDSPGLFVQFDFAEASISEVRVTVKGISSISQAQWRLPINH